VGSQRKSQISGFENGFEIRFSAFGRIHHGGVTPSQASCSAPRLL
jgi:hypothetical protein